MGCAHISYGVSAMVYALYWAPPFGTQIHVRQTKTKVEPRFCGKRQRCLSRTQSLSKVTNKNKGKISSTPRPNTPASEARHTHGFPPPFYYATSSANSHRIISNLYGSRSANGLIQPGEGSSSSQCILLT